MSSFSCSFSHFSSNFLHFLPHFGLPSGPVTDCNKFQHLSETYISISLYRKTSCLEWVIYKNWGVVLLFFVLNDHLKRLANNPFRHGTLHALNLGSTTRWHKATFYSFLCRSANVILKTMYVLTNPFWTVQYLL